MKTTLLAILVVLGMAVAVAQMAQANTFTTPQTSEQKGQNADFGPAGTEGDGGWG